MNSAVHSKKIDVPRQVKCPSNRSAGGSKPVALLPALPFVHIVRLLPKLCSPPEYSWQMCFKNGGRDAKGLKGLHG